MSQSWIGKTAINTIKQSYLFEANNLGFKTIAESDVDYLLMLASADPKAWSSNCDEVKEKIKNDKKYYSEKGYGAFLVFELNSGEFIGRAGFGDIESGEIEVGYVVLEKYRGKGYATMMLKSLLLWAQHNIKKDKIIAITKTCHVASYRVMQKTGMVFSRKDTIDGVDCVVYEHQLRQATE
ncbi:MAG: GNAT family N-acetyltransferase [Oligoflexia bacterium]|nr:GNAT family N-acetyltransferase [Oligoflexia bacterium]